MTAPGHGGSAADPRLLTGVLFGRLGAAEQAKGFYQELGKSAEFTSTAGWASPLQRGIYRRSAGRLSLGAVPRVLLLTTTGRRTRKARTVPLLYIREGDRLVVCNVNPGFERPNPWVLNLRAEPRAWVQLGRGRAAVRAQPTADQELDSYWPQLTKI